MAQCEEERCRNMSIFQTDPTLQWAILIKSPWDVQMASISNRNALAKHVLSFAEGASSLRGAHFGPICSPFGRLDGVINRS